MSKQSILPKHAPRRDQFSFHKVCTQCSTAREARTWSQLTTRNDRSKHQTLVDASSSNSSSPFPRGTAARTLDGSCSSVLPAMWKWTVTYVKFSRLIQKNLRLLFWHNEFGNLLSAAQQIE